MLSRTVKRAEEHQKMSLSRNFDEYKEELELIYAQNRVECDLYPIISQMIRESKNGKKISVREVSTRRESDLSMIFKRNDAFTDFVIMTRELKDKYDDDDVYGCIEAKKMIDDLEKQDYFKKLLNDHIKSFGKVIYTNCLEWRYFDFSKEGENKECWSISLGTYSVDENGNGKLTWNDNDDMWYKLMKGLDDIDWKNRDNIPKYTSPPRKKNQAQA